MMSTGTMRWFTLALLGFSASSCIQVGPSRSARAEPSSAVSVKGTNEVLEFTGKMLTFTVVSCPQKLSAVGVPGWANSVLWMRTLSDPESDGRMP